MVVGRWKEEGMGDPLNVSATSGVGDTLVMKLLKEEVGESLNRKEWIINRGE